MSGRKQLWIAFAVVAGLYGVGTLYIEITDAIMGITKNWGFAIGATIVAVFLTVFAIYALIKVVKSE